MSLPKVIIVGEAPLSPDLSGTGQTIYNLFSLYPPDLILSYVPEVKKELFGEKNVENFLRRKFRNKVETYNNELIKPLRNRFGPILNPIVERINLQILQWKGPKLKSAITDFDADLVIICPNEEEGMLEGYLLAKKLGLPFLIYLMDDWMHLSTKKWWGNNAHTLTFKVLNESAGWIMISNQLKDILIKRYNTEPKKFCVAHNPVSMENKPFQEVVNRNEVMQIAYAGSIWPMHYDSLLAIAQGVHTLKSEGKEVELIIYSFEHFWEMHRHVLIPLGVKFGGRVDYKDLNQVLQRADLLLVTSTFGDQYKSHTLSSLQTKITDYMVAGRAILACGPDYSACNLFVKEWDCGVVCETQDPLLVKNLLSGLLCSPEQLTTSGKRGYEIARNNFTAEVMCPRLYNILAQCVNLRD